MAFEDDVAKFIADTERRNNDVFVESTVQVRKSVVEGSTITGSPGQPADTGALRASWIDDFTSKTSWQITTNQSYAQIIEEGVRTAPVGDSSNDVVIEAGGDRPSHKSEVGGEGSVKMTVAGWDDIVKYVNRVVK